MNGASNTGQKIELMYVLRRYDKIISFVKMAREKVNLLFSTNHLTVTLGDFSLFSQDYGMKKRSRKIIHPSRKSLYRLCFSHPKL